jgi:hypothetical protein
MMYELFMYPNTAPDSQGSAFIAFFDAAYTVPLSKHLSLGMGDSFVLECGRYAHVPDVDRWTNVAKAWLVFRP